MPDILTPQSRKVFNRWHLDGDYKSYRLQLIEAARVAHGAFKATFPTKADKEDFVEPITGGLLASDPFTIILNSRQHVFRLGVHEVLAEAMARYLLDKDWNEISR